MDKDRKMTSICVIRLKSFIIDFYLDYINPTSPRTQFIKRFVYALHIIVIFNMIVCYIINDEQVSLMLYDIPHFMGGIRLYNTIILILITVYQAYLVRFYYIKHEAYKMYFTEMLEIFRRPTKLRLLIPYQNFVRHSPEIFKMVEIFNTLMMGQLIILGKLI